MIDRKKIENSLHKLFVTREIEMLPPDKNCENWEIRYQYI